MTRYVPTGGWQTKTAAKCPWLRWYMQGLGLSVGIVIGCFALAEWNERHRTTIVGAKIVAVNVDLDYPTTTYEYFDTGARVKLPGVRGKVGDRENLVIYCHSKEPVTR